MITPYYFDYAAATPVDDRVLAAMQPFWQEQFYNPSALYLSAKKVNKQLVDSRARVARVLGAKPSEIIFTAGGTESINLAIRGIMQKLGQGHILVSSIEHEAVLEVAKLYDHSLIPVDSSGRIDLEALASLIKSNTVLISVMHANNELGSIQPLSEVRHMINRVRRERLAAGNDKPLHLHVDASQTANYLDLHTEHLGADLLTVNGGKIYGPKQTGILYKQFGVQLEPQILGGGQEFGLRSGTENVAGAVGFSVALELAQTQRKEEFKRLEGLKNLFVSELTDKVPSVHVNSRGLPNFVHITIPAADNERLVMELDEAGIQCAVGSACSASNDEPSHVLAAIGMDESQIRSSLRFTMGRYTTRIAVLETVEKIAQLCR
jgi:cysteine desulfurase